uniref:Multiple epidermal growth factor-like domains protein 8-like n=1 Tax=Saccoglossus kowalevskii TaxID=10224 RepID=A0ABM0M7Z3_SACKO|nr:PREDICTED: multiple epidermal growth factor-like domains protein 8-like [Saccoglossus kowalevskii]
MEDIKVIGEPMKPTVSSAAVAIGNDIYIMGGFNGITHGTLVQLTLPDDLCTLHSTTIGCLQSHGCSACVSSNTTACFSNALSQPPSCEDEIAGVYCNRETIENRECEMLSTCSECLSPYPVYPDADLQCQWCYSCPVGRCIDKDLSCQIEHNCDKDQQALKNIESCPELICEASDCNKCISISACMWTRQIKKEGETRSTAHEYPIYDWSCFSSTLRDLSSFDIDSVPPSQCPVLCHEHSTCYKCLSSKGADGGWQECVWSEGLQQCMSPTYIQLQCVNGICEHVVRYTVDGCPTPCSLNTMCSTCLNQPGCGWCSFAGENGVGVCMAGGIHGPAEGGVCTAQNVSLRVDPLPAEIANYTLDLNGPPVWSFGGCPPENECRNGHHNCAQTEKCNDTLESYQCDCKEGYERDRSSGVCKPVCTQGCFNGQCVQPNVCDCYFGYVGGNCSIECECNGHSNCESIESRHKCIHCYNNTQGDHCEECLPFYVGNPENNGTCQPCRAYCNGNSDICMSITDYNLTMQKYNMLQESKITQSQANEFVSSGAISNAICIGCENNSEGDQCETCIDGFFKMDGQCIPCECNGHWDWCDKETGLECQCDNHTETVCTGDNNEPCWKRQCASCKELYIGEPTNSHQCYRQMQYNNVYCFATTQSECDTATPPKPLPGGKSVFFAIQPKYTNVDIRLLIDVTVGALDVYLSYSEDTWVVTPDPNNGRHIINIDDKQYWEHSRRRRDEDHRYARETQTTDAITAPPTQQSIVNDLLEIYADGLNTFVTIHNPFTFLIVYSLRNRLVVTFPHVPHELETRKFYIVLLSKEEFSQNETHGILTFRQDQPHIDLFSP